MIKNIKTIAILVFMIVTLTGCTEKPIEDNSTINESTDSIVESTINSTISENNNSSSSTTTESELDETSSTDTSSKSDESKPTSASSKETSSTTTKPTEKPVEKSTISTTTSRVESESVEKPTESIVTTNYCKEGEHTLEVMSAAEGPEQWHKETHTILDCGFDVTLAERCFPDIENPVEVFKTNLKNLGIDKDFNSNSIEVEIWGYKATVSETCTKCDYKMEKGPFIDSFGEFKCRYIDNTNPIFYDPNNIPQVVIDNIKLMEN